LTLQIIRRTAFKTSLKTQSLKPPSRQRNRHKKALAGSLRQGLNQCSAPDFLRVRLLEGGNSTGCPSWPINGAGLARPALGASATVRQGWDILVGIFDAAYNRIAGIIGAIRGAVSGVSASIAAATPAATAPVGVPSVPDVAGARAGGGPVSGGRAYLVGERGPELFAPARSGLIIPNHALGGRAAWRRREAASTWR
jgi:hypothetical protein